METIVVKSMWHCRGVITKSLIFFLVIKLGTITIGKGQDKKEDALKLLEAAYLKTFSYTPTSYYQEFVVKTIYGIDSVQESIDTVKVVRNGDKYKVESEAISIFGDTSVLVNINKTDNIIFITSGDYNPSSLLREQYFHKAKESLYTNFKVIEHTIKKKDHTIILEAKSQLNFQNIEKITYVIGAENSFKRISIKYQNESNLKSLEWMPLKVKTSYKQDAFAGKVTDNIYDDKGDLKVMYKNYEVKDLR